MNKKKFYDKHINFSFRSLSEYFISPGIRCKFDILQDHIDPKLRFNNALDLGCSGNSFLYFLHKSLHNSLLDLANLPLKQYVKKKSDSNFKNVSHFFHPICGDVIHLPYRNKSFDFLSMLDVIEHIKNDELAIAEISRILKNKGLVVVTVPHRMKYYTHQDNLIGHYRRYEIKQIISKFDKYGLNCIEVFGVYGQIMRISYIQSTNVERVEKNIISLRDTYENNVYFRNVWDSFVWIIAKLMKIEAKYRSLKNMMNIALIFIKN